MPAVRVDEPVGRSYREIPRWFGNAVITLFSYPRLFGVADNNGYGLKVFAFMKLAGVPFIHEHIFDFALEG